MIRRVCTISLVFLIAGTCFNASAEGYVKTLQNYIKGSNLNLVNKATATTDVIPGGFRLVDPSAVDAGGTSGSGCSRTIALSLKGRQFSVSQRRILDEV